MPACMCVPSSRVPFSFSLSLSIHAFLSLSLIYFSSCGIDYLLRLTRGRDKRKCVVMDPSSASFSFSFVSIISSSPFSLLSLSPFSDFLSFFLLGHVLFLLLPLILRLKLPFFPLHLSEPLLPCASFVATCILLLSCSSVFLL